MHKPAAGASAAAGQCRSSQPAVCGSTGRERASWPAGDSATSASARALDWAKTPLGAIDGWPQSLRTAVDIVLGSRHPMFLAWGPQLIFIFNDAYGPLLGARIEGAMGRPFAQLWADIWPDIEPLVDTALSGGATWAEDLPLQMTRNGFGETAYFTFSYSPIRLESGDVGGMICAVAETTAKVLAERENARLLAEQRDVSQSLRQLFDLAPSFMAVQRGPNLVYEQCNQAFYQVAGHRDLIGKSIREAFPEIEGQGYWELQDEVYATGKPFIGRAMPAKLQLVPGGPTVERYVDLLYQPLFDANGSVIGIFTQGYDVTEHHRALVALRDSEERLRLAMQSAELGVFDFDAVRGVVKLSPRAQQIFDLDAAVDAAAVHTRVHAEDLAQFRAAQDASVRPGSTGETRAQYRVCRRDGSVRWVQALAQWQFKTLDDGTRQPVRQAGVIWDVTEQQHMIEQLRQADVRKNEFLAMLGHELRNPLAPLTNAHRLLERTEPLSQAGRDALTLAQRQTQQLRRLVDDLLEVSRITQGKIEIRPEPMDIGKAVHAAVESITPGIEQRAQRIAVHGPSAPVRLQADPVRIAQILENLLTNASKYTPEGGAIHVEVEQQIDAVAIRVIDNGVGIESAKIAGLFEVFHQIDATLDRAQGGLGIGLALVKRLVELHGGTVAATSAGLGQGATFTVRLPREPGAKPS